MRVHSNWDSEGFAQPAIAPAIGPFASPGFLAAIWDCCSTDGTGLLIAESDDALAAMSLVDGTLELVGHRDLVDYRSPRGAGVAALIQEVAETVPSGTTIRFDSLPDEAVGPIVAGLTKAGVDPAVDPHSTAAVLALPPTFDEYLTSIGKKERHELRRKRRRYEASAGPTRLECATAAGDVFDQFIECHRRSSGDKASFMSSRMVGYFGDLIALPGWQIDALLGGAGEVAAATFSFEDDSGYYLYNSAYDPDLRHLSPGQVLLGALIEQEIVRGRGVFDFLKGDEPYKYRLGSTTRQLYEIVAVT
jgi:CelD/BcsL family acetyltransferase involved in cellulose biosynthesis